MTRYDSRLWCFDVDSPNRTASQVTVNAVHTGTVLRNHGCCAGSMVHRHHLCRLTWKRWWGRVWCRAGIGATSPTTAFVMRSSTARRHVHLILLPFVHRSASCIHKEISDCGWFQTQLPCYCHLHLFRGSLRFLKTRLEYNFFKF